MPYTSVQRLGELLTEVSRPLATVVSLPLTYEIGLNRLPLSFHPLIDDVTTMGRKIERVQWDEDCEKVNLQWRDSYTDRVFQNASYDYTVFALPFSIVKKLRLPSMPFFPCFFFSFP